MKVISDPPALSCLFMSYFLEIVTDEIEVKIKTFLKYFIGESSLLHS